MKSLHPLPIALLLFLSGCYSQTGVTRSDGGIDFHVSPEGKFTGNGTESAPFATPARALKAVRQYKAKHPGQNIRIVMHGGAYELHRTLVLTAADSGTPDHPLVIEAAPGEHPVLSGGTPVTGWTQDGKGRFKAALPAGLDDFRQLWVDGRRALRPRAPVPAGMKGWGKPMEATVKLDTNRPDLVATPQFIPGTITSVTPAGYTTTDAAVLGWKNPGDIEFGYMMSFEHKIAPVKDISKTADGIVIEMDQPGFFLCHSERRFTLPAPTYVENVFEYLDTPGEFYLDRPARTVYYLPRPGEDLSRATVIAPRLETLVEVQGAHDVKFEGLTFAHATWRQPSSNIGLPDLQASILILPEHGFMRSPRGYFNPDSPVWNPYHMEGVPSHANVVLDGTRGVRFDGCAFTALGGTGLSIENGAQSNSVSGCRFEDISCNGISVGGVGKEDHHPSDPAHVTKDNRIENNLITRTGVEYTDSVGIFYGYTDGTVIAHNELHNMPYSAISGGWGWGIVDAGGGRFRWPTVYTTPTTCRNNLIESNRAYDIMKQHIDGGAVYLLGRQDNTHIRYNHFTDTVYPGAIYFDEGSAGSEASFNVIDPGAHQVFDYGRGFGRNNFTPPAIGPHGKLLETDRVSNLDMTEPPEQFTLSAWVYLREYPTGGDTRRWIACHATHELANGNISLLLDGDRLVGSLNEGGGPANLRLAKSDKPLPIGRWMQVDMSYDGQTLRLYCDGNEIGATKIGKAHKPAGGPLVIGTRADHYAGFGGDIGSLAVYNRALTPSEIKRNLDAKAVVVREGLSGEKNFETATTPDVSPEMIRVINEAGLQPEFKKRLKK